MGRGENYSSESDEDTDVRHDRFRSERFKESRLNTHITGSTKSSKRSHGNNSKKYRERSPPKRHLEKTETSQRKELRCKYDELSHRSKADSRTKYEKSDLQGLSRSQSQKNRSGEQNNHKDSDEFDSSKTSRKKLSSILMNFDKKMEYKRLNSESLPQIGPSLPPHLAKKYEKEKEESGEAVTDKSVGPALPPYLKCNNKCSSDKSGSSIFSNQSDDDLEIEIKTSSRPNCGDINEVVEQDTLVSMGPELPPHLKNQPVESVEETNKEFQENNNETNIYCSTSNEIDGKLELYGPPLPPAFEEDSYGPALPPNFKKPSIQGPTLPSGITSDDLEKLGEEESDNEDTFGPLPVGKMNITQYQLELRAMDIKRKLEEEKNGTLKDIKKREEWMLELPPEKASNLGLGPRSFRMKEGPDMSNRSMWTDTPAEKKRKEEMALRGEAEPVNSEEVMRSAFVKERNETMDKISKLSQDEDRHKSLLEIHQKKLKKKKKKEEKEGKKKERRPFDRNIDLQVHRFDEAQKKAIFKKAQLLDTRFSSGESKYL